MIFMAHQLGHTVDSVEGEDAAQRSFRMLMGVGTALLLAVLGG